MMKNTNEHALREAHGEEKTLTAQDRIEGYLNAIKAAFAGETPLPDHPEGPVWRIELFLAAILSAIHGDSPVMECPEPVWRIEEFGRAIYDAIVGVSPAWPCPRPTSNIEEPLYAIYTSLADGEEPAIPSPSWDIERWLDDVYEAAKGWSPAVLRTVTGLSLHVADALSRPAESLTATLSPMQAGSGDPSPDNIRPISGRTGLSVYVSPTQDETDATAYTAEWTSQAGTVYGGTVDLISGVLTVDSILFQKNTADMDNNENYPGWKNVGLKALGFETKVFRNIVGNVGDALSTNMNGVNDIVFLSTEIYNKTQSEWKALAIDVQFVLPLPSPQTYNLTPQEIRLLRGENNLWSDADSLSLTYYADGRADTVESLNNVADASDDLLGDNER